MTPRFIFLVMAVSALGAGPFAAQAQGPKPVEGTLMLDKKSYSLKQALAYETTIDNEEAIAVVLSGQAVSSEQLKEARKAEKEGSDSSFKRPFVRLVYKKSGEIKHYSAGAGSTSIGRHSGTGGGEQIGRA